MTNYTKGVEMSISRQEFYNPHTGKVVTITGNNIRNLDESSFRSEYPGGFLPMAIVRKETLDCIEFKKCFMWNCDFNDCSMINSTFVECNLSESMFRRVSLRETKFIKSNLWSAKFTGCEIRGVDFSGSELVGVVLKNCEVRTVSFGGAIVIISRAMNSPFVDSCFRSDRVSFLSSSQLIGCNLLGVTISTDRGAIVDAHRCFVDDSTTTSGKGIVRLSDSIRFGRKCHIVNAKAIGMDFSGIDLSGSTITGCTFRKCRFSETLAVECNWDGTVFDDCDLDGLKL